MMGAFHTNQSFLFNFFWVLLASGIPREIRLPPPTLLSSHHHQVKLCCNPQDFPPLPLQIIMTDIREKSISLLSNTLNSLSSQGSADTTDQATAVEAAVYEKHEGDTGNEYRDSIRQLSLNLKNNPELGTNVASGEVSASTLAQMTSEVS
jgi:hypothetical protein